jgi:nitroimidazol reductase NimA-like FMN-containing flavoprotein (pyridoxamine 5'-phosphate oxidase superfamily)
MAEREPVSQRLISEAGGEPPSWELALEGLRGGANNNPSLSGTYWLATVHPDGRPHVMPLFAVWLDGNMYFCSNPGKRKAKNIAQNPNVAITAATGDLDVIVEGKAAKVTDEDKLAHIREAFIDKYGWPVEVEDHAFTAPFGAPTAGGPPYEVYEVVVKTVFGLGTSDPHTSARWDF